MCISPAGQCDFYLNVQMVDQQAVVVYGAPATMWIRYTVRPPRDTGSGMNISLVTDYERCFRRFYEKMCFDY